MRLYLTGFMGAGKTTTGRILSGRLGWSFFDLDHEIERTSGASIAEIFDQSGEESFRLLERNSLQAIQHDPAVIATGGGCFIHNEEWMLKNGTVIYLEVPFDELASRIGADPSRPLWKNAERLFRERHEGYRKAHLIVDATKRPEQIAEQIAGLIKNTHV